MLGTACERGASVFEANLRQSREDYYRRRGYLWAMPRFLGLVLGNACNIDCPHCYQEKNGDNLLRPAEIGRELRREFAALYPYLATLRVQGGEVLAYRGFADLAEDVAEAAAGRPLLSVSTNGTLLDDEWAERMVRLPFGSVTVSIDGASAETYARLRRGSELELVLANVARLRRWKDKFNSALPELDSFFVVMRSNYREIPAYLELMDRHGFSAVALQTMEVNRANTSREPGLAEREAWFDANEASELHEILQQALPKARRRFAAVRISGLRGLFEKHGLDAAFLQEQENGLYPDSDDLRGDGNRFELCPNPWTTLFVAESGAVHLCFLSEPVGNVYETPLSELWNSPRAVAKRLRMMNGRYLESGCSERWCGWREGMQAPQPDARRSEDGEALFPIVGQSNDGGGLGTVRRMLAENNRRTRELEQAVLAMDEEFQRMRRSRIVRAAAHVARRWDRWKGPAR